LRETQHTQRKGGDAEASPWGSYRERKYPTRLWGGVLGCVAGYRVGGKGEKGVLRKEKGKLVVRAVQRSCGGAEPEEGPVWWISALPK